MTGVSGSGKTTLVLESLIPALEAVAKGEALPAHVESITAPGIAQVKLIDATPIGINVRSTVATYANVHDELRKIYARSPLAREKGYKAGDFSYNTGRLRCPGCDGTGTISLDIQFLPDVEITCPDCGGSRYQKDAAALYRTRKDGTQAESLPRLMEMSVDEALAACSDLKLVASRLQTLSSLGLGYLTLGEATPQPFGRGSPSGSSSPARWAKGRLTPCLYSTSPPSACTRWMCALCWACSSVSLTAGPLWWSLSTIWM